MQRDRKLEGTAYGRPPQRPNHLLTQVARELVQAPCGDVFRKAGAA